MDAVENILRSAAKPALGDTFLTPPSPFSKEFNFKSQRALDVLTYTGGVGTLITPDQKLRYSLSNVLDSSAPDYVGTSWGNWQCTQELNTTDVVGITAADSATALIEDANSGVHVFYHDVDIIPFQRYFACAHFHEDSENLQQEWHARGIGGSAGLGSVTQYFDIDDTSIPSPATPSGDLVIHDRGIDRPSYLPDGWMRYWTIFEVQNEAFTEMRVNEVGPRGSSSSGNRTYIDEAYCFLHSGTYEEAAAIVQSGILRTTGSAITLPRLGCIAGVDGFVGYISENAYTNELNYVDQLDQWGLVGVTVTADNAADLSGNDIMDLLTVSTTYRRIEKQYTLPTGYSTFGAIVNPDTSDTPSLNVSGWTGMVTFDLTNETISDDVVDGNCQLLDSGLVKVGSHYIIWIVFNTTTSTSTTLRLYPDKDSSVNALNANNAFLLEGTRDPCMPLFSPAEASWSTYTKVADQGLISGLDNADWFDEDEGFAIATVATIGDHDSRYVFEIIGASSNDRRAIVVNTNGTIQARMLKSSLEDNYSLTNKPDPRTKFAVGLAWSKANGKAIVASSVGGGESQEFDLTNSTEPSTGVDTCAVGTRKFSTIYNLDGVCGSVKFGDYYPAESVLLDLVKKEALT